MDYMMRDSVDAEVMRLSHLAASKDFALLSRPGADSDIVMASAVTEDFSPSEIDEAAAELAERTGIPCAAILEMTRELAAGPSANELAAALATVASDLAFAAESGGLELSVSDAKRHELARTGLAMPDGSFPCHDASHLAAAKSEYAKGHLAGHSKKAVKDHINHCAKQLGLPGLDEDDHQGLSGAPQRMMVRHGAGFETVRLSAEDYDQQDGGPEDEVMRLCADHPGFFGADTLELAARHGQRDHGSGRYTPRRGQTHLHTDEGSSETDTDPDSAIDRYLAMSDKMFGVEKPHGANQVYKPKSRAQREREERRARAGHGGGSSWSGGPGYNLTQDTHRGS